MKHDQVQKELSSLIGQEVLDKRIAGNSIILYFGGEPGDDAVISLGIHPSWRYSIAGKWVSGSGFIFSEKEGDETDDEFQVQFDHVCGLSDPLLYSVVKDISLAADSCDIEIIFEHEQRICSFAFAEDYDSWDYYNRREEKSIHGSLDGYLARNIKTRTN